MSSLTSDDIHLPPGVTRDSNNRLHYGGHFISEEDVQEMRNSQADFNPSDESITLDTVIKEVETIADIALEDVNSSPGGALEALQSSADAISDVNSSAGGALEVLQSSAGAISESPLLLKMFDMIQGLERKCDYMRDAQASSFVWIKENIVVLQQNSAQVKIGMNRLLASVESVDHSEDIQDILTIQTEIAENVERLLHPFEQKQNRQTMFVDIKPENTLFPTSKDQGLPSTPHPLTSNGVDAQSTLSIGTIDFKQSAYLKNQVPEKQSTLEHLLHSDDFANFVKQMHDLGHTSISTLELFEMYNILIQVPSTPVKALDLVRDDEPKFERHASTILNNLTTELGDDCCNAVQLCGETRKLLGEGIMGHKAILSTNPLLPVLWALTTTMRAMTELPDRIPIVLRIQAIWRTLASGRPATEETLQFLKDPAFMSELLSNDWYLLCTKLHGVVDLVASRKLDMLCTTFPNMRQFGRKPKHLKDMASLLTTFNLPQSTTIRVTNVIVKCIGLRQKADVLIQGLANPGQTDLQEFYTYDHLLESIKAKVDTAREIYFAFNCLDKDDLYFNDILARVFIEIIRHGTPGAVGINPKGQTDFNSWKDFFQGVVSASDLEKIEETVESLDIMHQALCPVVSFSDNTGKEKTIQEQRKSRIKPPRVAGGVQGENGKGGRSGLRSAGGKGGRGKGGSGKNTNRQGGGDVQPTSQRCSFCRRPWCLPEICNPNGTLVKVPGIDNVLHPGTYCWRCGGIGHRDGECGLSDEDAERNLAFYASWWDRTEPPKRPPRHHPRKANAAQNTSSTPSAPPVSSAPDDSSTTAPSATATSPAPQIHPGWFSAPPLPQALPIPTLGMTAQVPAGAAVVKPPDTKTIKINGDLYQKV